MKLPIRRKVILFVGLPTLVIYLGLMAWILHYSRTQALLINKQDMQDRASAAAARFDDYIAKAARVADTTALFITRVPEISEEQLYGVLRDNVGRSHRIYGAAIAFEPGTFLADDSLFCPYAFKGGDVDAGGGLLKTMNIGREEYDWYGDEIWEWWHRAKEENHGIWTAPYFDEGAGNILMTTYSVPFYDSRKVDGGEPSFRGVATVDIDLDTLQAAVGGEIIRDRAYHVIEPDGTFVYSTQGSDMFGRNVFDVLDESGKEELKPVMRRMLEEGDGELALEGLLGEERKLFAHASIPSTGWVLITGVDEKVALAPYRERGAYLVGTFLGALGLIALGIFFVSGKLTQPMHRLRGKVLQIADGAKDISLDDIDTGDEIEELAGAFDVMQRKVADREAKLENARETTLTELLESAPEAMLVADSKGRIRRLNKLALDLFGYTREEMMTLTVQELMPESAREVYAKEFARYFANPEPRAMGATEELAGLRKDGSEFPIEKGLSPFHEPEGLMTVAAIRDITERKRQEMQLLLASQQAEAANKAKSEFLSHMSHELRTPLNGVLGYAQALQRTKGLNDKQRGGVDSIVSCGDHLLSLINDVLDLSKIEAERIEIDKAPSDLHKLFEGVVNILSPKAAEKGVAFEVEVGSEVPVGVVTDAAKLRQILVNLLGNAVKFTSAGEVRLCVAETSDKRIRFEVIDSGVGIAEDEVEAIFDPFKQVEAGKAAGGTGLGLAITKKLVEMLGGELKLDSEVGKGSTFHFSLPLEEVDLVDLSSVGEAAFDANSARLAPGQEITVLVADDRETNRDILDQMLEDMGFSVLMAEDGDEAVELTREKSFDIVLMDVRMPRMNGIEAVGLIRQNEATRDLKVIAVTASVFPEFKQKAIEAGFDDFLAKPFRASELIAILKYHLDIQFVSDEPVQREETPPAGEVSAKLPPEALEDLRAALKIKNLSAINGIAARLGENPDTAAAGAVIGKLARAFDFAGLEKLAEG